MFVFNALATNAQRLAFTTSSGDSFYCPLSIRPVVSGYLPAYSNLISPNYQLHDLRSLQSICAPADSVLSSSNDQVIIISKEWPCSYTQQQLENGALLLITVDSNNLYNARIPVFENNSDQFGSAYVIATTEHCADVLNTHQNSIESIVFDPEGQPLFSNFSNTPTYHISEDIDVLLPCRSDDQFTLAMTIPPRKNLELEIHKSTSTVLEFDWLTLGRSFADRRSKQYEPTLANDKYIYSVTAGVYGDLVQISPRCVGVDSFLVSVRIKPVVNTDSCALQTTYPFTVSDSFHTQNSISSANQYRLTIPFKNEPISFMSDFDELKDLPSRDPQGDHKSYYAYDDFMFDLSIANLGACSQLNYDLNGGQVSSTTRIRPNRVQNEEDCNILCNNNDYNCEIHPTANILLLSDQYELGSHLPSLFDVAHCSTGNQSFIVPSKL